MCGIAGSLDWTSPADIASVQIMTDALRHRGPDAGSVVARGPIALGHRRLAVIDSDPAVADESGAEETVSLVGVDELDPARGGVSCIRSRRRS